MFQFSYGRLQIQQRGRLSDVKGLLDNIAVFLECLIFQSDTRRDSCDSGESTFKGYVRPNSPMDKFENQLTKVLRTLNEKIYNEKK